MKLKEIKDSGNHIYLIMEDDMMIAYLYLIPFSNIIRTESIKLPGKLTEDSILFPSIRLKKEQVELF
jgi:hypothetical protein